MASPVYGELLKAQFENLAADITGSPVPTGIAYYNTVSNLLKYYDGGATAWRTLVTENSTQTLTGKTVTSGTLLTCLIDDYVDFNEESAPSTPASGKVRMYAKSDGKFYRKDDAGNEYELGAGGSGELNNVDNPNDANAGWTASGAGITVATTTTGTDLPLAGIFETAIKITPVSSTDYVYYRWTMPASLKNTKLKVQWNQRPLSGYATGDLKVEVYKNSASNYGGSYTEFNLSTDSSGTSSIPNQTGRYVTYFDADDGDYYELRIVRVAGTTALNIVNVIVGPGIQPQGAVIENLGSISVTPLNFGTVTNASYTGTRIGSWLKVEGRFKAGTPVGSSCAIGLPTGLNLDTTQLPSADHVVGKFGRSYGTSDLIYTGNNGYMVYQNGVNNGFVYFAIRLANDQNSYELVNGSSLVGSGDMIDFEFFVPIAEWAGGGNVNLGQNDVEYAFNTGLADANDTTSFGYGPAGTVIQNATITAARTRLVRFQTPIQPTDTVILEISDDQATWMPFQQEDVNLTGNGRFHNLNQADGIGFGITSMGGTDVTVEFQQYRVAGSNNWSANLGFWRLKKIKSGQAVGFGLAGDGVSGLLERASRVQRKNLSADNTGTSPNASAVADLSFNNLVDGRWYTVIVVMYETGNAGHLWLKWGSSADNTKYAYFRTPTANTSYCYIHTFQVSGSDLDVYHGGSSSSWQDQDGNETPSGFTGGSPKTTYSILIEHPNVVTTSAFT